MKGFIVIILFLSLNMTMAQPNPKAQPDRGDFSLGLVQRLVRVKGLAETIMAEVASDTITRQLDSLKRRLKVLRLVRDPSEDVIEERKIASELVERLVDKANKILEIKRSYRVLKIAVDEFASQLTIDIQYRKVVYLRFYRKIDRYYKDGDSLRLDGRMGNYRRQLLLIDESLLGLGNARAALNPSRNAIALGTVAELGTLLKDIAIAFTQNRAKKVEAIVTMLDKVRLREIDGDSGSTKEDDKK